MLTFQSRTGDMAGKDRLIPERLNSEQMFDEAVFHHWKNIFKLTKTSVGPERSFLSNRQKQIEAIRTETPMFEVTVTS